jgi:hypothetical protein
MISLLNEPIWSFVVGPPVETKQNIAVLFKIFIITSRKIRRTACEHIISSKARLKNGETATEKVNFS